VFLTSLAMETSSQRVAEMGRGVESPWRGDYVPAKGIERQFRICDRTGDSVLAGLETVCKRRMRSHNWEQSEELECVASTQCWGLA